MQEAERFTSAHELGGWLSGYLLDLLDLHRAVPAQMVVLGEADQQVMLQTLRTSDPRFLLDALREHLPYVGGLAIARVDPGRHRRSVSVVVETFDANRGVTAAFLVKAHRSRMTEHFGSCEVTLMDISGISLAERNMAQLDCRLSFEYGLHCYHGSYSGEPVTVTH